MIHAGLFIDWLDLSSTLPFAVIPAEESSAKKDDQYTQTLFSRPTRLAHLPTVATPVINVINVILEDAERDSRAPETTCIADADPGTRSQTPVPRVGPRQCKDTIHTA